MRALAIVCLIGGLLLTGWLVLVVGAPALVAALRAAGWMGLLAIAGFHLIATTLMGLAWWNLRRAGKPRIYVWGRLLRDAGSELLPLSQIGGYVFGARVPIMHGVGWTSVAATVVVDATLEFCAQIAFIALGVALLLRVSRVPVLGAPEPVLLVLPVAAATGFVAIQLRSSNILERISARFTRLTFAFVAASEVQAEIREIYRANRRLLRSFLLHFTAWLLSGVEAWLALQFMGARRSLLAVMAIESLLYAARGVAFIVPGAIGIQESAYVMLGASLGLPPDIALGLSLLKRARDLVLGIPALVSWQIFERRQFRRNQRSLAAEPSAGG